MFGGVYAGMQGWKRWNGGGVVVLFNRVALWDLLGSGGGLWGNDREKVGVMSDR